MNSEASYRKSLLEKAMLNIDHIHAPRSIKIFGQVDCTKQMNITDSEYARIKEVLLSDNTDTFTLKINTANSAFKEDQGAELAIILRHLADQVEKGYTQFPIILDSNGNDVGEASLI